ncbi:MAG: hypothetical protein GY715_19210 [Planctomycetes bacterium]|nr:hypothetical protein [Planctomycetota bacterium]
MSSIGPSPLDSSLVQAAQAQQTASKSRDRERAVTDRRRRFQDLVDLRVAAMEGAEAVRQLPSNDSEQAEVEHESHDTPSDHAPDGDDGPAHLDIQA